MKITYLFRHKQPHLNSIETVFGTIISGVAKHHEVETVELPHPSSPLGIVKNLLNFKKDKNTLYHITGHVNYMAMRTGRNTILTIHDTNSAFTGNRIRDSLIKWLWYRIPGRIVGQITAVSEQTRRELIDIIPSARKKISVIPNPVSPVFKPTPIPTKNAIPIILFIGTKPNKNLERSIAAIKDMDCRLVVIGQLTSPQKKLLQKHNIDYENEYNISQERLVEHYQQCNIVLFPSLYEGFGMPVLEALATGRPVVTSPLVPALKYVKSNQIHLVDPHSVESIREGITTVLNSKKQGKRQK